MKAYAYWIKLKTSWQKEPLFNKSNFTFYRNGFKFSHLLQKCYKLSVCGKQDIRMGTTLFYLPFFIIAVSDMKRLPRKEHLPRPTKMHHIVEDFLTTWDGPISHLLPLRRFLENVVDTDLRNFYADECLLFGLTGTSMPYHCEKYYMNGEGVSSCSMYREALLEM